MKYQKRARLTWIIILIEIEATRALTYDLYDYFVCHKNIESSMAKSSFEVRRRRRIKHVVVVNSDCDGRGFES